MVGLFAGRFTETVSIDGFSGVVGRCTPTAVFEFWVLWKYHSVTPEKDDLRDRAGSLFLQ